VKSEPILEAVDLELAERQAEVLPGARKVDEADVDHLDALRLRPLEHLARTGLADRFCLYCHEHPPRDCIDLTGPRFRLGTEGPRRQVELIRTRWPSFCVMHTRKGGQGWVSLVWKPREASRRFGTLA